VSAIFLLLIVGNLRTQSLGGFHWHSLHSQYHDTLSFVSKLARRDVRKQHNDPIIAFSFTIKGKLAKELRGKTDGVTILACPIRFIITYKAVM
jgi:hypothetical protein